MTPRKPDTPQRKAAKKKVNPREILEEALALLAHEGFHGLKTYESPRAAYVEEEMWDYAATRSKCPACILLIRLKKAGIIYLLGETIKVKKR